jgi:predicted amidohydrolase YtcJ
MIAAVLLRTRAFWHEGSPRMFDPRLALVLGAIALGAVMTTSTSAETPKAAAPAPDLVIWGGRIVTMDPKAEDAEAIAMRGDRIVAVGKKDAVAKLVAAQTRVIDLKGAIAVPGLTDAHGHFFGIGDAAIQLDLTKARSFEEIVEQVRQAAAATPKGEWIRGRGWHQDKWDKRPERMVSGFPVHDALSAVSPDHPVVLTHASGHASIANAKAMELGKIGPATADPPGGDLVRDEKGRPTGLFNETAQDLVHGHALTPGELRRMAALASQECLRKGITSFHDAGTPFPQLDLLKQLVEDGTVGVRLWMMAEGSNQALAEKLPQYLVKGAAGNRFSVGGIKRYMDGALGSRGALLLAPYSDAPETSGLALAELDDLRETARIAAENKAQLCVHAIGDKANRLVLDVFEETFRKHPEPKDRRWRIEHAQHIDPQDIPRFGKLGVIASVQTVHCTSDGPWVPDRLGAQRCRDGAYPWRTLLETGAHLANGTDAPVEDVDPIANYYSAVTRKTGTGQAFYPGQSLTRHEALAAATLWAAYAAFEEKEKGSLEVGKLADVTVLSKDILQVPEEEIKQAQVLYTIVGGKVAYERK